MNPNARERTLKWVDKPTAAEKDAVKHPLAKLIPI